MGGVSLQTLEGDPGTSQQQLTRLGFQGWVPGGHTDLAASKELRSFCACGLPPQSYGRLFPGPSRDMAQCAPSPALRRRQGGCRSARSGQRLLTSTCFPWEPNSERVSQAYAHPNQEKLGTVRWPAALQRSLYCPKDTKNPHSVRLWDPFQLGQAKWTHFPERVTSG